MASLIGPFLGHGGRLETAQKLFPAAPTPWIDLSTGINPHAYPIDATASDLRRLPFPEEIAQLEQSAARAFGCADTHIAAVPGADVGLRLIARIKTARRVTVISPTYSGHAEAWTSAGAHVVSAPSPDDVPPSDVVILINPNNPDGRMWALADVLALAQRQHANGGWLIVDESFGDIDPAISVASHADEDLVVIRSFGKFFGLPGLRLGFIIGSDRLVAGIRAITGSWPVNVLAAHAGCTAYADAAWHADMRARLKEDAARLDQMQSKAGFKIVGGTTLFRLAAHDKATDCFLTLARLGILTRPFDYAPTWLRFGFPRVDEWERLAAALEQCS
jgi:cobalamin biosynthetic protein CobC